MSEAANTEPPQKNLLFLDMKFLFPMRPPLIFIAAGLQRRGVYYRGAGAQRPILGQLWTHFGLAVQHSSQTPYKTGPADVFPTAKQVRFFCVCS
jgi:hypothetical protein